MGNRWRQERCREDPCRGVHQHGSRQNGQAGNRRRCQHGRYESPKLLRDYTGWTLLRGPSRKQSFGGGSAQGYSGARAATNRRRERYVRDGKPAIRPKRKNRPGCCDFASYAGLFQPVRRRNPDSHTRPALHAPCLRFRTTRAIPEYPEEIRLRALRPGSLKGVCRKSRRVQAQDDDGFLRAIVLDRPVERR